MITKNLIGQKFNRLLVEEYLGSRNQKRWWLCKCDCGNTCEEPTSLLTTGGVQSCGCLQRERTSASRFDDLSGKVINGIYIDSISDKKTGGRIHWNCVCFCGNHFVSSAKNIKSGNTKSCGCIIHKKGSQT